VKGRKRHIAVDSLGLLLRVKVHAANLQDKVGVRDLLCRVPLMSRWRYLCWDSGYRSPALLAWATNLFGVHVLLTQRREPTGFQVVRGRWKVERTFAWLGKWRRLSKDYEYLPAVSEAFVYVAMIGLMLHRLSRNP
jgi:putative transposase